MIPGDVCLEDAPKIKVVGANVACGGGRVVRALFGTDSNLIEANRLVDVIMVSCQKPIGDLSLIESVCGGEGGQSCWGQ